MSSKKRVEGELMNKLLSHHSCVEVVKNLVDACCPMMVDATCVRILVDQVCTVLCDKPVADSQEEEEEAFVVAKKGVRLLKVLASIMPSNFGSTDVFQGLINLFNLTDVEIAKHALQILDLVGRHIDAKVTSCLQPILTKMALSGPVELAKYSVRCIQHTFKDPQPILEKLCTNLVSHVDYDDPHFHTVLISLGQVAKLQPEVFAPHHKTLIKNDLVKQLIAMDRNETEYDVDDTVEEWCEDDDVTYETQAKVYATKLLVNWLLGSKPDDEKTSLPVVRLLSAIIQSYGDLQQKSHISPADRSRLRLAAACGLLKLAASPDYKELITVEQFQSLACVIQDTCEQVRSLFALKLNKGLRSLKLPLRYLAIFVMAGAESRKTEKANFRSMMISNVEQRRKAMSQLAKAQENPQAVLPEYAVSYAVYLISHHPDFRRTDKLTLDKFKDLLWFFLEPIVVKGDNYGFVMKLLETIKHTVDAQNPDNAEKNKDVYTTCDVAMGSLDKLNHIKLGSFAGEVLLPTKLYALKDKDSKPTVKYLPPGYDCTPSKIDTTGTISVKKEDKEAVTKKATPKKRAKPDGPKSKVQLSAVTKPKTKVGKKRGFATSTPAVKPNKGKSPAKAKLVEKKKSPRKRKQPPIEEDDGGHSDNEEEVAENEQETESEPETPKQRKRQRVANAPRKRNVRRKVLQNDVALVNSSEEETDAYTESADVADNGPSPAVPVENETVKPKGSRRSNRRGQQKAVLDDSEKPTSQENETVEPDSEATPSPRKKRKVAPVEDKTKPTTNDVKTSGIKRKARHRR